MGIIANNGLNLDNLALASSGFSVDGLDAREDLVWESTLLQVDPHCLALSLTSISFAGRGSCHQRKSIFLLGDKVRERKSDWIELQCVHTFVGDWTSEVCFEALGGGALDQHTAF